MIARLARLFAIAIALAGCAEIIGIHEIGPDAGDAGNGDGGSPDSPIGSGCTNGTLALSLTAQPDELVATNGYLYVVSGAGIGRCALGTPCTDPPLIVQGTLTSSFLFGDVGSSLVYTLQESVGGSVHSNTLDATGDQTLFTTTTASPTFVARGGSDTYWVDDNTNDVHCIGCVGQNDATWITGFVVVASILADANVVYALAQPVANVGNFGVYACPSASACASAPTKVIDNLDQLTSRAQVASNGSSIFVARTATTDVVRVDSLGPRTVIATGLTASAIAVDATNAVYGTSQGEVGTMKSDGTAKTTLASCDGPVIALTLDATHAYALVTEGTLSNVYAIPR